MIDLHESAEAYHRNAALGSGDIRDFLRSPRLFSDRQMGLDGKDSPALLFGQASHMALLEPIRFARSCAFKPRDMNFATKEGKAWKATMEAEGKLIVTHDQAETLQRMHDRMPPEVREIFGRCNTEVTVRNVLDGIPVQCRPDAAERDWTMFYDLKTIDAIESIERAVWKYSYHVQLRFYARVITNEGVAKLPLARLIFAEKAAPYRWRIVTIDADYMMMGDEAVERALAGIAERQRTGDWSDGVELHEMVSPPSWALQTDDEEDA